jgi:hypothetical protein
LGTRNNVVDREFLAAGLLAAVPAGQLVTLENVAAARVFLSLQSHSSSLLKKRSTKWCVRGFTAFCH